MTDQRRLIVSTLESLDCHPTAEELYRRASQQDTSLHLSTVYRTLRWMEAEGLVSTRQFREEGRPERFDPALPLEHHHFVCTRCKGVIEFVHPMLETIKDDFRHENGAVVDKASVVLYGICQDCQP